MHVKGWSRQQAIDFRIKYGVMEPEFQAEQVDRRIAWLGQGHAYAVGASEILSLREEAKKALGPKFDLKEFHSRVLEDGPPITLRCSATRSGDGSRVHDDRRVDKP